ncbi:MAG: hypothetical protein EOO02_01195 [Chitinophagaceae bacterium]|nr:MAG: hypothetical protein EOO02_01195 [Chitinophagaceae bacterium]
MTGNIILYLSPYSILFAAVIGVIRFKEIEKSYYPFLYICWLGLLFEVLASIFQFTFKTMIPSNTYVLFEGLLYIWLFRNWGSFQKNGYMFYVILSAIVVAWILDNFVYNTIHLITSRYRIFYSIILVILSIDHINKLIVRERKNFLRNAKFLICMAVISFFTYKIITEVFWMNINNKLSETFFSKLFGIQHYVNLIVNLLFAYVMLWIPKRKNFLERLP